ncbi:TonB-dependent receptor [Flavobacterium cellulosilyticum]|uniref:TonB-dependent receptor n=1 Tax=Flavobacterium cellulosilyticum TaxID=2541731 RepID=A0A4R5CKT5_9FLAO|nr:TonB-dependent receptor [Flavobacterium cellulosilyticum]TDD99816.1 TonB-dependent receptor [Flavobacterium cellulosilyticum]
MKTMKNCLLLGLLLLVVSTVFSQGKITGTVTDGQNSLPGTNVAIKGAKAGTSTDFDGKFSINTTTNSGELVISFIGFEPKTVKFSVSNGGTQNLGTLVLISNSNELNEVVVTSGVIDYAKDRKTPVAVSTIKAAEIQEKLGTQEFPEILKNTPSVYVTKQGGGFGDSRINIRGFDQKNIAVMINGVPVNDMENSSVYWSNWAGLSDVTSAMQVQRGLGSSKLAISSVGGTINVITKSSDMKEGGAFSSGFGNANYLKVQGSYNTGLLKNGLSASVLLSSTSGDGYIDGTNFEGQNYYIALGYKPSAKHDIQVTFTGAPQWHNQRSTWINIATYQKYGSVDKPNTKYNSDWGTLNGEQYDMKRNFYHKPVASINWDYKINETTKLSTIFYGSWGRGGGTSGAGGALGNNYLSAAFRTAGGLVDYDKIVAWNTGMPVSINGVMKTRTKSTSPTVAGQTPFTGFINEFSSGSAAVTTTGFSRTSSINSHDWYGGIVSLNKKLSNTLVLDFGIDARTYKGYHFTNINSLLGAGAFLDKTSDVNNKNKIVTEQYSANPSINPFSQADTNEKISFYSLGNVRWYGAFTQLEYSKDNLTAFVQGAVSQQAFQRVDEFVYLKPNALTKTDFKNILGGNVKAGANYNIDEQQNVFVNAGYYSKQPFFNAVYPNNRSVLNGNLTNEKIIGFEAGYGFRSRMFTANINLYSTQWKDRYQRSSDNGADNVGGYYDFSGITEVHNGIEFEAQAKVTDRFKLNGMFSIADWKYKGNSTSNRFDQQNNPFAGGTTTTLYLDKVKVGDAAQMTASIGASYEVLTRVTLDANYNYNDKLYAAISPAGFSSETNKGSLELPSYGLMDAGFSYKIFVDAKRGDSFNFRLNVNNVLDEVYIAESKSNIFASDVPTVSTYKGIATTNNVYFGFGRTWNFSVRYNF